MSAMSVFAPPQQFPPMRLFSKTTSRKQTWLPLAHIGTTSSLPSSVSTLRALLSTSPSLFLLNTPHSNYGISQKSMILLSQTLHPYSVSHDDLPLIHTLIPSPTFHSQTPTSLSTPNLARQLHAQKGSGGRRKQRRRPMRMLCSSMIVDAVTTSHLQTTRIANRTVYSWPLHPPSLSTPPPFHSSLLPPHLHTWTPQLPHAILTFTISQTITFGQPHQIQIGNRTMKGCPRRPTLRRPMSSIFLRLRHNPAHLPLAPRRAHARLWESTGITMKVTPIQKKKRNLLHLLGGRGWVRDLFRRS